MQNGKYELVIAPSEYPGMKYRGRYCYKHHLIFWCCNGVLPSKDEVIHHIDGNYANNDISNLKLLSKQEHTKLHSRSKRVIQRVCPICQKVFEFELRNLKFRPNPCCSRKCGYEKTKLTLKNNFNHGVAGSSPAFPAKI